MPTTWTAGDTSTATPDSDRTRRVIDHLGRLGALDEAGRVLDAIDAGEDLGEIITHDEALARMDRHC